VAESLIWGCPLVGLLGKTLRFERQNPEKWMPQPLHCRSAEIDGLKRVKRVIAKVWIWHIPDLKRMSAVPSTAGIHVNYPARFWS
jgi:hypothetical protein